MQTHSVQNALLSQLNNFTLLQHQPTILLHSPNPLPQVISAPSPSSGPQLLSFLNAMEEFKRRHGVTPVNAAYLTNVTQVLERTGALLLGLGDPDGGEEKVTERTEWMLDKRNAARY